MGVEDEDEDEDDSDLFLFTFVFNGRCSFDLVLQQALHSLCIIHMNNFAFSFSSHAWRSANKRVKRGHSRELN